MKKTNIILGSGPSAYIIAACLNYIGDDFSIIGNNVTKLPPILYLKYNNEEELKFYCYLFDIDYHNADQYTKNVVIGYLDENNSLREHATEDMIKVYISKQNRNKVSSSMSDGKSNFKALDLSKVLPILKDRYKNNFVQSYVDEDYINNLKQEENTTIYNTIIPTILNDNQCVYEYIAPRIGMPLVYDYVYDCRPNSNIKRYTDTTIERLSYDGGEVTKIKNYYESPKIYRTFDTKLNNTWIDISRNATKTQLKQEDIIRYIVGDVDE